MEFLIGRLDGSEGPSYEPAIRFGVFVAVLAVMAVWEVVAPRRPLTSSKPARWFGNLTLAALNGVAVRLALALGATGIALEVQARGWGLLNAVALPLWLEAALALVLLDLLIYGQHVLFHAVPLLWRLHLVHHADPDLDVTSGVRFHVLEILLSLGLKVAAIAALGPPPVAVLIFEVVLNAASMFQHSNVRLPLTLDRALRWLIVTPDMHRIHHSTRRRETNSNYGFHLSWWDYWFGTYREQPQDGQLGMQIGLDTVPAERGVGLWWPLALPFVRLGQGHVEPLADPPDELVP